MVSSAIWKKHAQVCGLLVTCGDMNMNTHHTCGDTWTCGDIFMVPTNNSLKNAEKRKIQQIEQFPTGPHKSVCMCVSMVPTSGWKVRKIQKVYFYS